VADFVGNGAPGILKYDATTGAFIGNLVPNGFDAPFNPRGLVFGPDGRLYVTVYSAVESVYSSPDAPGYILRFLDTSSGAFEIVASNNGDGQHSNGEMASLHNPEGIVFGPDGRLYTTSFRPRATDNGIVVLNPTTKQQVGFIPLGANNAQALLFGPDGKLFVPINDGGDAGTIRSYNVTTNVFTVFVNASPTVLQSPWYLTFRQTDPATLTYYPWHNFVNSLDVDDDGFVSPLDAYLIINELNSPTVVGPNRQLPATRGADGFYLDVTGDGFLSPLDVLLVINFLSSRSEACQGEMAAPTATLARE